LIEPGVAYTAALFLEKGAAVPLEDVARRAGVGAGKKPAPSAAR
jgi:hypothetical protein